MSDSIHMYLSAFRESVLTAVARLEFQLRDTGESFIKVGEDKYKNTSTELANVKASLEKQEVRLNELIEKIKNIPVVCSEPAKNEIEELLKIKETSPQNPVVEVGEDSDSESESEDSASESESDEEQEEPEIKEPGDDCGATKSDCEEDEESPPSLLEFELNGKRFYRDEENTVYQKVGEEEYEQIGEWDPDEEVIIMLEEEEKEEEEGLECEEFTYKGKTYLRDNENYVYTEDGEQIGVWDGKKIYFSS